MVIMKNKSKKSTFDIGTVIFKALEEHSKRTGIPKSVTARKGILSEIGMAKK